MKDFLAINDLTTDEVVNILNRADQLYEAWQNNTMPDSLKFKRIALWFWGNGFRNRIAFEIGARAMGADVSYIPGDLGIHEPIEDIGYYLNNWFNMAIIRCTSHDNLKIFSNDFTSPVINARTNYNHPCEIIGDLQFIRRDRGSIDNLKVVFVGEVTNLCMSWFEAAIRLPIHVIQVAPEEHLTSDNQFKKLNEKAVGKITGTSDLESVIDKSTDVIYTDCWPNDTDQVKIKKQFLPYQISIKHIKKMNPKGYFLPCPPVSRDKEVTGDSLKSELFKDYEAKEFLLSSLFLLLTNIFSLSSVIAIFPIE
jgi:ornithine carbamoyltransferase